MKSLLLFLISLSALGQTTTVLNGSRAFPPVPNSSTGTTLYTATKLVAGQAQIVSTSDTVGMIGVTLGGAGTIGNATIAYSGMVSVIFDNTPVVGDLVQTSTTTAG